MGVGADAQGSGLYGWLFNEAITFVRFNHSCTALMHGIMVYRWHGLQLGFRVSDSVEELLFFLRRKE